MHLVSIWRQVIMVGLVVFANGVGRKICCRLSVLVVAAVERQTSKKDSSGFHIPHSINYQNAGHLFPLPGDTKLFLSFHHKKFIFTPSTHQQIFQSSTHNTRLSLHHHDDSENRNHIKRKHRNCVGFFLHRHQFHLVSAWYVSIDVVCLFRLRTSTCSMYL